jgi:hypothetical protein
MQTIKMVQATFHLTLSTHATGSSGADADTIVIRTTHMHATSAAIGFEATTIVSRAMSDVISTTTQNPQTVTSVAQTTSATIGY